MRHRKPPRSSRTLIAVVLGVLTLAIVGGGILATQTSITHSDNQEARATSAESTAFDLAQQVKSACSTGQLHGPICSDAVAVAAPGAQGPAGAQGVKGDPGITPPCYFEPAQCRGTNGTNGTNGANGIDGKDGVDGRDGKDGQDGAQGPVGPVGPEGPPGPTTAPTTEPPPSP